MGGHHSAVAIRPWEGTLHPERPRALQLECPGPDKQASPGDRDELGEQVLGFFVCKFRETAACHTESLAGRGVRADWDLSRERRQLEAQCLRPRAVALSLQGWRQGVSDRCPSKALSVSWYPRHWRTPALRGN